MIRLGVVTTGCQCWEHCRFPGGDPVVRASHQAAHLAFAERDILPPRRFPPLLPDHESRLRVLAELSPVKVRRVDGTCHRFDCPTFPHPAHTA